MTIPTYFEIDDPLRQAVRDALPAIDAFIGVYIQLMESGDCGSGWTPEEDEELVALTAAMNKVEATLGTGK